MKIISPSYLGNHNYNNYEAMKASLSEYLSSYSDLCLDLDFLHAKEVQPYIVDILLPCLDHPVYLQSKSRERMKKVLRILKDNFCIFDAIEKDEEVFLYFKLHK